jgi:hypothetical protein
MSERRRTLEETEMRTWWAAVSVIGLCVVPALAQARDRGHERRDGGERHSSATRRDDRGARGDARGSQRAEARREPRSSPRSEARREPRPSRRFEARRDDGYRRDSRRDGEPRRRETVRRGDDRGRSGGDRGRSGRDRRYETGWRGFSYRSEPYRSRPYYRARPLRYPGGYRHGYFYGHGYYYPRYYFDAYYDGYADRAALRILVEPRETEVYVDGYYAGIVDDFDGFFQRLYVAPGAHEITLRLDGFATWSGEVFAAPGSTLKLHHYMQPGPSGELYEPGVYAEPPPYR